MARHIVTAIILFIAMAFALLATLGVLRSKNNFAALHCVGVLNVMAPPLALLAVLVSTGLGMSSLKMLVVTVVILLGAPITSHAIAVAEHRRKPR
jgi:monovalent cation/proton antiporter MnhG/PhaG subunit